MDAPATVKLERFEIFKECPLFDFVEHVGEVVASGTLAGTTGVEVGPPLGGAEPTESAAAGWRLAGCGLA